VIPGIVAGGGFGEVGDGDPYFSNVVMLLHFDGADGDVATVDSSSFAQTIGFTGDAQLDTGRKKFGSAALLLDGTDDWCTASDASLNLNNALYTVEAWLYYDSASYADGKVWFSNWVTQGNGRIIVSMESSGEMRFVEQAPNGTSQVVAASAAAATPKQQWFHCACVRTGVGGGDTMLIFIDGIQVGTATAAARSDYGNNIKVGAFAAGPGFDNPWIGSIDDFRITKGIARYLSDFTPPAGPFSNS
jgi:hypothetical protein